MEQLPKKWLDILIKMKTTIFSFFICLFITSVSFANQKEITQLNKLLNKGYDNHFNPYVVKMSKPNKFTCTVNKLYFKENRKNNIQSYNVPKKDRDTIIFQTSNNFHFTSIDLSRDKIGFYYNSAKLNQKNLAAEMDKLNWQFTLPTKSNKYKIK